MDPQPEPASQPADQSPDDELSKRLIRQAVVGGEDDVMTQIVRMMSEVHERLGAKLDPGAQTQALQKRILDQLDQAIKKAMQQRRRASASATPAEGERRKMPAQPKPAQDRDQDGQAEDASDPNASGVGRTDAKATEKLRGPLRESRRGWGHLPKRDREELIQSMDEEVIERYREQIDQYYRALGDQPEEP